MASGVRLGFGITDWGGGAALPGQSPAKLRTVSIRSGSRALMI
jgi:hypothetical protein